VLHYANFDKLAARAARPPSSAVPWSAGAPACTTRPANPSPSTRSSAHWS